MQVILTPASFPGQSAVSTITSTGQLTAVHSGPLQVLLELGAVGFFLYLATLVVPISQALTRPRDMTRTILIGATLGVLFTQFFDNSTFGYAGILMFALVAVLRRDLAEASELSLEREERQVARARRAETPNSSPPQSMSVTG